VGLTQDRRTIYEIGNLIEEFGEETTLLQAHQAYAERILKQELKCPTTLPRRLDEIGSLESDSHRRSLFYRWLQENKYMERIQTPAGFDALCPTAKAV
jgi:hypothetical protein